jgi:hypothetical protein
MMSISGCETGSDAACVYIWDAKLYRTSTTPQLQYVGVGRYQLGYITDVNVQRRSLVQLRRRHLASPRLASFHKVRLSDDQREFWCKTRLDITYKDRGFGHDRCAKIENSFLSE